MDDIKTLALEVVSKVNFDELRRYELNNGLDFDGTKENYLTTTIHLIKYAACSSRSGSMNFDSNVELLAREIQRMVDQDLKEQEEEAKQCQN